MGIGDSSPHPACDLSPLMEILLLQTQSWLKRALPCFAFLWFCTPLWWGFHCYCLWVCFFHALSEFLHLPVPVTLFHCKALPAAVGGAVTRPRVSDRYSPGWCRNRICPGDVIVEVDEGATTLVWWAVKGFVDGYPQDIQESLILILVLYDIWSKLQQTEESG